MPVKAKCGPLVVIPKDQYVFAFFGRASIYFIREYDSVVKLENGVANYSCPDLLQE